MASKRRTPRPPSHPPAHCAPPCCWLPPPAHIHQRQEGPPQTALPYHSLPSAVFTSFQFAFPSSSTFYHSNPGCAFFLSSLIVLINSVLLGCQVATQTKYNPNRLPGTNAALVHRLQGVFQTDLYRWVLLLHTRRVASHHLNLPAQRFVQLNKQRLFVSLYLMCKAQSICWTQSVDRIIQPLLETS